MCPAPGTSRSSLCGSTLVEPPGVAVDADHPVLDAGHDRHRQLAQLLVALPHRRHRRHHGDRVLGLGADLPRPDREAVGELAAEARPATAAARTSPSGSAAAARARAAARPCSASRRPAPGWPAAPPAARRAARSACSSPTAGPGRPRPPGGRAPAPAPPACPRNGPPPPGGRGRAGRRRGGAGRPALPATTPSRAAGAVAEAGAVDGHHPVPFGDPVEHAAPDIVLGTDDVAVQQDDRRPGAPLEVVQPDAVDLEEPAARGMLALGPARPGGVPERGGAEGRGPGEERRRALADRAGGPGSGVCRPARQIADVHGRLLEAEKPGASGAGLR